MELFHSSRYGDWNAHNRWLLEETQQLGGNKYREIYLKLMEEKDLIQTLEEKLGSVEWEGTSIEELEEDVEDYEKAVKEAEQEVKDANEWLMKQKVYLAEAIIKLHNERTNHNNV